MKNKRTETATNLCMSSRRKEVPAYAGTAMRLGPFRFFFYSNEDGEPVHIHIRRDRMLAKFWLAPVVLASSTRFPAKELKRLEAMVIENREILLEAWNEHFGS